MIQFFRRDLRLLEFTHEDTGKALFAYLEPFLTKSETASLCSP
jgi:hypothetical protein